LTSNIPYTTFREHLFGNRVSRERGAKPVLTAEEEKKLSDWLIEMAEAGHGLSATALKIKVSNIAMGRDTPFRNGIPGAGWLRGWKCRHPELSMRTSQALEVARARGMCELNVRSFYNNLEALYATNKYSPDRIWNCDESGAQAGKNGGGVIIARTGARRVHSIVPDQREWLSVLVCINADGSSIPSFYIFKGKRFGANYIQRCESGATMAMQPKVWMTSYLFSAWISHFIASIRRIGTISPTHRHLLILDGHASHATLDVIQEARSAGLDLITLPSHTSHALQPLDVAIFKPFKQYFREYRDFWTSRNMGSPAGKETLAQWVSLALKKALTSKNIKFGFAAAGIMPLNQKALDGQFGPSKAFEAAADDNGIVSESQLDAMHCGEGSGVERIPETHPAPEHLEIMETGSPNDVVIGTQLDPVIESAEGVNLDVTGDAHIESDMGQEPNSQAEHFFVDCDSAEQGMAGEIAGLDPGVEVADSITRFLTLPTVTSRSKTKFRDPILDFTTSHILTSSEFTNALHKWKEARENTAKEKERKAAEREETRKRKATEKEEARAARVVAREEAARQRALKAATRAEEQARKRAERQEAQSLKVQRAAQAAAAKAAEAAEKARRAQEAQEAQRLRMHGIAENAGGCQCHRGGVDIHSCEVHGLRPDLSTPGHTRLHQNFTGSPSHFNRMVSNNEIPTHTTGTHLQSTPSIDPVHTRLRNLARSTFPRACTATSSSMQTNQRGL
jgi:hypothetical protein